MKALLKDVVVFALSFTMSTLVSVAACGKKVACAHPSPTAGKQAASHQMAAD